MWKIQSCEVWEFCILLYLYTFEDDMSTMNSSSSSEEDNYGMATRSACLCLLNIEMNAIE